ncbi:MAG: efflux RND transporter permease subunit, partial [Deltaproteobacteria bacterium]
MRLSDLSVERPVTTVMAFCSLIVLGGIAWVKIPITFLPDVDFPHIWIQVRYPNANPTQVEKEIVKPLEEALSRLEGLKRLRSTATPDGANLNLEFTWGERIDLVRMAVGEQIDLVRPELPEDVGPIFIFNFDAESIPVVQARISSKGIELSQAYDLLETRVLNRLRRIPGVAKVDLGGVAPPEVFIDLELHELLEHDIEVGTLIERLQASNLNLPMGRIRIDGRNDYGRILNAFASFEEIRAFRIPGTNLVLDDIGEVRLQEPPIPFGRYLDGEYAVSLEVYKESTANTVDVVRAVMKTLSEDVAHDPLLQGIEFFVWEDQAEEITRGIAGIRQAGVWGGIFATCVLFLFIRRLDATLIVSLSIPLAIIGTIAILYLQGSTLNILSMMGLMLGVGMLVDNAVVVLESIYRRRIEGMAAEGAAKRGAHDVGTAVTAATLTTMIVFLPLIVGARMELTTWLREIGIALCLTLACSWLTSLTMIPLAASRMLRGRIPPPAGWLVRLLDRYTTALAWTQRHPTKTLLITFLALGFGALPFALGLKTGIFAGGQNKRIWIEYDFKDFTYKSRVAEVVRQVEEVVGAHASEWGVAHVYSWFGENRASTGLFMEDPDLGDEAARRVREEIRKVLPRIPGVRLYFENSREEGGTATYFGINIYGEETETLRRIAERVETRLHEIPDLWDIQSTGNSGRREVQVSIDRERAARLGLSPQDIARIFRFTLGGTRLRRFHAGNREVDMSIALRLEDRENAEDLKRLLLRTREGRAVRLGDIANFAIVPRAAEIRRENRKTRVTVRATYEGDAWKETRKRIERMMNAFDLPPGTTWSFGARVREEDEKNRQMAINLALALVLVYIVMASLFESILHPFAIVFSIPFALVGVSWLLFLTKTPFNIFSQIGLLILMGIVVNNGIVLIDHINKLRREGIPRGEAILRGSRERFRPILITAATTVLGLIPLAVGKSGIGGGYY